MKVMKAHPGAVCGDDTRHHPSLPGVHQPSPRMSVEYEAAARFLNFCLHACNTKLCPVTYQTTHLDMHRTVPRQRVCGDPIERLSKSLWLTNDQVGPSATALSLEP